MSVRPPLDDDSDDDASTDESSDEDEPSHDDGSVWPPTIPVDEVAARRRRAVVGKAFELQACSRDLTLVTSAA